MVSLRGNDVIKDGVYEDAPCRVRNVNFAPCIIHI